MEPAKGYVNVNTDEKGITTIAFFHPAQNSLPAALLDELALAIQTAGADALTHVIILKSDGDRTFCAGANFDELLQITNLEQGMMFFSGFAKVINACRTSQKMIIGRVHGKAIGGGIGIASACDHCFATENASIKLSELSIGIGPFVIEPAVTRKMGLSAFSQLALNAGEFYTAQWAKERGLFAEVFETTGEMDKAIAASASKMAVWNPEALSALRKTLWHGTDTWDTLLTGRAAISGELVLSEAAQTAIGALKKHK
ncbi:enoyl-CoA hydratase [Mucilaginibacter sp. PPCGB 2223]|uniref:enoyl-CoA hydratase-related protein n=1 Tax=Mucilaginibacter sp. PPCGB 2223 TaxID=1886027 RepID=UPI00082551BE|nr:enoyl-CoA hydratase-related protein [Mucilaginibacter sp. PPCGB 2223]OCX53669.1 enoyl-CoA hydratase [Mucilaginibacter sp. PPCGB 2223]